MIDLDSVVIVSATVLSVFNPWNYFGDNNETADSYYADLPKDDVITEEEMALQIVKSRANEQSAGWWKTVTSFAFSGDTEDDWFPIDLCLNNAFTVYLRDVMTTCIEMVTLSEGVRSLWETVSAWRHLLLILLIVFVLFADYWRWSCLELDILQQNTVYKRRRRSKPQTKPGLLKGKSTHVLLSAFTADPYNTRTK